MPSGQPSKTDQELVELLGTGDENAFEMIFNAYFEKLCLFSESITHDHNVAEEIVENIFLNIWLNCKINPVEKSIKSYLFQSVYNNSLKYNSRQKKNVIRLDDESDQMQSSSDYPVDNLITQEINEKAESIINAFPEQCKRIYLLNRNQDLKYHEIAEKLQISVGTVKTQMSRAFEKLRKGLSEFLYVFF